MLPLTKTLICPAGVEAVPAVTAKPAATFLPVVPTSNKFKHGSVEADSSPKAINAVGLDALVPAN